MLDTFSVGTLELECFQVMELENENTIVVLTGMVQFVEHHPAEQKVAGSIPAQGTFLGL